MSTPRDHIDTLAHAADQESSPEDASFIEARRVLAEPRPNSPVTGLLATQEDPVVVAGWIAETKVRRARAEQVLRGSKHRKRMTREEIAALVATLGDIWATLQEADPADKAEVYRTLGWG